MNLKIEKSIPIIKEMLTDREYDNITDINKDNIYIYAENDKQKVVVSFIKNQKNIQGKGYVKTKTNITKEFELNETDKIIFVLCFLHDGSIPSKFLFHDNNIEVFNINRLLFNIMKHRLSPQYKKLNSDEIEDLKIKWNLNNISKISIDDPAAKYFDMKIGDIFKIIRNTNNSYQYITYRRCI